MSDGPRPIPTDAYICDGCNGVFRKFELLPEQTIHNYSIYADELLEKMGIKKPRTRYLCAKCRGVYPT